MIPRHIHQTAKTADVSPQWAPLVERARKLHPEWTYKLWTDDDNLDLIRERRPDLLGAYQQLARPVMRADMIRYVFMEQIGGLYFDTDYQWLKPFNLVDADLVLPASTDDGQTLGLGNAVFASRQGHPFWTTVLDEIRLHAAEPVASEDDVIRITGPGLLTRVYQERFNTDTAILIPPRREFHPPVPQEDRSLAALTADPRVYGIHWCFGSWRSLSWKSRLARWARRFWRNRA